MGIFFLKTLNERDQKLTRSLADLLYNIVL